MRKLGPEEDFHSEFNPTRGQWIRVGDPKILTLRMQRRRKILGWSAFALFVGFLLLLGWSRVQGGGC